MAIYFGTSGSNTINGTSGSDIILAGAGNDIVNGGAGSDIISGGIGDDTVDGGSGSDIIYGDDGNDKLTGGTGDDLILGGAGNDFFYHNVTQEIDANGTFDYYDGNAGSDTLVIYMSHAQLADLTNSGALAAWNASNKNNVFNFQQYVSYVDLQIINIESIVIVTPNRPPVAQDLTLSVDEDTIGSGQVIAIDPDGNALTFALVGSPLAGLTFNADGTFSFDANSYDSLGAGQTQTISFDYTVNDAQGGTDTGRVNLTVVGVNDTAIIQTTLTGTVVEDDAPAFTPNRSITVSDADLGQNSVQIVSSTLFYGNFTFLGGSWSYTIANGRAATQALGEDRSGTDTLVIRSFDGSAIATITVRIVGTNDAAVIGGDNLASITEDQDVSLAKQLTVSDVDSGESVFQARDYVGIYGTLTLAANGQWTYDLNNADVQYLKPGESLVDNITVRSADNTAHVVSITIDGRNDSPVLDPLTSNPECTVVEDVTLVAGNRLNMIDPDQGENGFRPLNGATGLNGYGQFSIDDAGNWFYALNNSNPMVQALSEGQTLTDFIQVRSVDGTVQVALIAHIVGTNDAAVIGGVDTGVVVEDAETEASGQLTITDSDGNDFAIFQSVDNVESDRGFGVFSIDFLGNWTYQLDSSKVEFLNVSTLTTDTFTVRAVDGTAHVVTITISGTDDAPVISGVLTGLIAEDAILSIGGNLTIRDVDNAAPSLFAVSHVVFSDQGYGVYSVFPDEGGNGVWEYRLNPGAVQFLSAGETTTDTFTVYSSDTLGSQVVTVTITGINDAAVIGGVDTGVVVEDAETEASGQLTITDVDGVEEQFFQTLVRGVSDRGFGLFSMGSDGEWIYLLDNSKVQFLAVGDSLVDTFTVYSADNTDYTISVTILGGNDDSLGLGVLHVIPQAGQYQEVVLQTPNDPIHVEGLLDTSNRAFAQHLHVEGVENGGNFTTKVYTLDNFGNPIEGIVSSDFEPVTRTQQTGTDPVTNQPIFEEVVIGSKFNVELVNVPDTAGDRTVYTGTNGDDALIASQFFVPSGSTPNFSIPIVLAGLNGDDLLIGSSGADILLGGADSDSLIGGKGNDVFVGGSNATAVEYGLIAAILGVGTIDQITALLYSFSGLDVPSVSFSGGLPVGDYIMGKGSGPLGYSATDHDISIYDHDISEYSFSYYYSVQSNGSLGVINIGHHGLADEGFDSIQAVSTGVLVAVNQFDVVSSIDELIFAGQSYNLKMGNFLEPIADPDHLGDYLNVVEGTNADDVLIGSGNFAWVDINAPGAELRIALIGYDGNDYLHGLKGESILDGGAGNDVLVGDYDPREMVVDDQNVEDNPDGLTSIMNNTLFEGAHDVFKFSGDFGQDVIKDLNFKGVSDTLEFDSVIDSSLLAGLNDLAKLADISSVADDGHGNAKLVFDASNAAGLTGSVVLGGVAYSGSLGASNEITDYANIQVAIV